mgnify:CR=1 FL=1
MIKDPNSLCIKVIGVGGAGGNAVDRMIQVGLKGVEFIAVNTDSQALAQSEAPHRLLLGPKVAKGLGVGGDPEWGARAAEEGREAIRRALRGAHVVFIAAGMGGGTGTGAAPVVARIAKEQGALTIAEVTRPFSFEGAQRCAIAEKGVMALSRFTDSLIVVSNDRLLQLVGRDITFDVALRIADDVLRQGIQSISELITQPGLVNLDFASIRTVMERAGGALMAIGRGRGEGKAVQAAKAALNSPLLDFQLIGSAKTILVNITGGPDLTLHEVSEAAQQISEASHPGAEILFGAIIDPHMEGEARVILVAGGIDSSREEVEPARKGRRPSLRDQAQEHQRREAYLAEVVPSTSQWSAPIDVLDIEEPVSQPASAPPPMRGPQQEFHPLPSTLPLSASLSPDLAVPVEAERQGPQVKPEERDHGRKLMLRFLSNLDIPAFLRR